MVVITMKNKMVPLLALSYNMKIFINNSGKKMLRFNTVNKSQDSIVSIVTGFKLDGQGLTVQVPVGEIFFSSPCHPDQSWGLPSLLSNGYQGLFPRG
jgi:hypothetical protein